MRTIHRLQSTTKQSTTKQFIFLLPWSRIALWCSSVNWVMTTKRSFVRAICSQYASLMLLRASCFFCFALSYGTCLVVLEHEPPWTPSSLTEIVFEELATGNHYKLPQNHEAYIQNTHWNSLTFAWRDRHCLSTHSRLFFWSTRIRNNCMNDKRNLLKRLRHPGVKRQGNGHASCLFKHEPVAVPSHEKVKQSKLLVKGIEEWWHFACSTRNNHYWSPLWRKGFHFEQALPWLSWGNFRRPDLRTSNIRKSWPLRKEKW